MGMATQFSELALVTVRASAFLEMMPGGKEARD